MNPWHGVKSVRTYVELVTGNNIWLKVPRFKHPEPFDFPKPADWPQWEKWFMQYRTAIDLGKDDEEVQVPSLIYAMGTEAEHMLVISSSPQVKMVRRILNWS